MLENYDDNETLHGSQFAHNDPHFSEKTLFYLF